MNSPRASSTAESSIAEANTTETHFTWTEEYEVGHEDMDATHREFVSCVDGLLCASDDELGNRLDVFAEHARSHFADEDMAMRGGAYAASGCHIEEHEQVLRSLDEVRTALNQGRPEVVRAFGRALAAWFPEHARVMDLGLARWLTQQRLGGAPVLIRPRPRHAQLGVH